MEKIRVVLKYLEVLPPNKCYYSTPFYGMSFVVDNILIERRIKIRFQYNMTELNSWSESQKLLEEGTKERPSLVIHYWNECGHCKAKMPMWERFSRKFGDKYRIGKLEQSKNGGNISSFPTYQGKSSGQIRELNNVTEEEDENKFEKQLFASGGGRRRRRHTTRFIRRGRKATHRTLRRHKSFVK